MAAHKAILDARCSVIRRSLRPDIKTAAFYGFSPEDFKINDDNCQSDLDTLGQ
eukprot:Pgem_evm1s16700